MALLVSKMFKHVNKEKNSIHAPASAGYTVFTLGNQRIFQIDTYGRSTRQDPGKISQSVQIDESMAKILIEKLQKTFDLK